MSKREPDAVDITKLYECFSTLAIQDFNDSKQCMPRLIMVSIGDAPGDVREVAMVPPELVNRMQENAQSKAVLMHIVSTMLANGVVDCVVHVSEIWMSSPKGIQADSLQDAMNKHRASGIAPSEDPERGEALMVSIHTKGRTYAGFCPITGVGPDRVAEFKPLLSGGELGGGMVIQGNAGHVTQ